MSGFIPKRVLNARIGTTIEKNQTPMEAGLAPRIGKSAASIRLYYQRVDECFCPAPCEPITIVKRIVWYPYNNALDSQGNSRPNGSNYVAIQFNKPLSVFPDPGLTNPTIQGWGHPIPGGWSGGNPALMANSPIISDVFEASSPGLRTQQFPIVKAPPIVLPII